MTANTIITLNQDSDTPARHEVTPSAVLTYLYDRSRDSKKTNTLGQDFVAFAYDNKRIAFAVCDGVSQSFYGDLAARFLGEKLVQWFFTIDSAALRSDFPHLLEQDLYRWTVDATTIVREKHINPTLPALVQDAIERKRENGSETMFVAGLVELQENVLALAWMGDMRLWLWSPTGEPVHMPEAVWETRERWSSRVGPKNGAPRTTLYPLERIARIVVHTDGIGSQTDQLQEISLDSLNRLAWELSNAPASDDVSVLDIAFTTLTSEAPLAAPQLQHEVGEPAFRWNDVPLATFYRVSVDNTQRQWTVDVSGPSYLIQPEDGPYTIYRVQAMADGHLPGLWSDPLPYGTPQRAPLPATGLSAVPTATPLEPVVNHWRPFRIVPVMALALSLALMMTVIWIATNLLTLVR